MTLAVSKSATKKAGAALSARELEQRSWLSARIKTLTTSLPDLTPSEWATKNRYLPKGVTNTPGYYSFDRAPYLEEICDALGPDSDIRELAAMKGAQLGFTTLAENIVGYCIDYLGSVTVLWYTTTNEAAQERLASNILPMIQQSELSHKIKSSDEDNKRKTGKTLRKLEFAGGGKLLPLGAETPANFRSLSAQILIRDEIDSWKQSVGLDGDPLVLSRRATATFEDSRKIFDLSTPTIKEASKIHRQFLRGDQRYYNVNCLGCSHPQVIKFKHKANQATGIVGGLMWDLDEETKQLVPGSVRYVCPECGHAHHEADKLKILFPAFGAKWVPTATPVNPSVRSYHLSSLYSLLQSWEDIVGLWLEAWDVEKAQPKDLGLLQVFYNHILGEPFEIRGEKLQFQAVSQHRRSCYRLGEVPNRWATEYAASPIQLLTCAVDVHKDNLAVGVFGFTKGARSFVIDYWRFEGDVLNPDDLGTWGRLSDLIENKIYVADDGKRYKIALTLIDSGYQSDLVHSYAAQYSSGVVAIKGETTQEKRKSGKSFHQIKTQIGQKSFGITVDSYKEKVHNSLRRGWDRQGIMPEGHWSGPTDLSDDAMKELTCEKRVEVIDPKTKRRLDWKWVRPAGAKNELWDISVYTRAALEMLAWDFCRLQLELEQVSWPEFWAFTERGAFFVPSSRAA